LFSNAASYPNGTLIRADGDYKVFVIYSNKKRWLRNEAIFNSYKNSWDKIKVLSPKEVSAIPYNNLIRADGTKVYALNDLGYKRHILNPDIFSSYNLKWEDIADINQTEFANYPDCNLARQAGDLKIYYILGNVRRWIVSPDVFYLNHFNPDAVQIINAQDMSSYVLGDNITGKIDIIALTPTPTFTSTPAPTPTPTPTPVPIGTVSLTLSKDSSPASSTVYRGASNVSGLGIIFTAGTGASVKLTKLTVRIYTDADGTYDNGGYGSFAAENIVQNVSLYDDADNLISGPAGLTLVGTIGSAGGYYKAEFPNLAYNFPAGTQKKLVIKANLNDSFSGTKYFAFDVKPSADVQAQSSAGNPVSFSDQISNLNLSSSPSPSITCIQPGVLTVEVDSSTPAEAEVFAGTSNVVFAKYKFSAQNEAMTIKGLKLFNDYGVTKGDYDNNFDLITISYPKNSSGTIEEKMGYFSAGSLVFDYGQIGIYVPQNSSSVLSIRANLKAAGQGMRSGDMLKIGLFKSSDQWSSTGTLTNDFIVEGVSSGKRFYGLTNTIAVDNTSVNKMIIEGSKPTLASATLPSSVLIAGAQVFYKWAVTASGMSGIAWKLITFYVTGALSDGTYILTIGTDDTPTRVAYDGIYGIKSGGTAPDSCVISNIKVYNSSSGIQIGGTFYYRSRITSNNAGGYYLIFVSNAEEDIAQGATGTYELRGTFSTPLSGASVSVNIPSLSSSIFTNTYDYVAKNNENNSIGVDTSIIPTVSFVWSDQSAVSHSISTKDWRNDYKVSGLPTSASGMAK